MATNIAYTAANRLDATTGVNQLASGKITFPATAIVAADSIVITLGFKPRFVQFCNATSRIMVEFYDGMDANTCIKTAAAGTRTIETTNGGITVTDTGFSVLQNSTLAAILASEVCYWRAVGN